MHCSSSAEPVFLRLIETPRKNANRCFASFERCLGYPIYYFIKINLVFSKCGIVFFLKWKFVKYVSIKHKWRRADCRTLCSVYATPFAISTGKQQTNNWQKWNDEFVVCLFFVERLENTKMLSSIKPLLALFVKVIEWHLPHKLRTSYDKIITVCFVCLEGCPECSDSWPCGRCLQSSSVRSPSPARPSHWSIIWWP